MTVSAKIQFLRVFLLLLLLATDVTTANDKTLVNVYELAATLHQFNQVSV